MNEKPNYYAVIPAMVRYDNDLKPNEKLLYGEITSLANKNGVCFAGNEYFANLYGVTKRSISDWLSHLKEKKYIKVFIQFKKGTKEIKRRTIIVNGSLVTDKINIYKPSTPQTPEWLNKEIESDEASPEELEEFLKLLEG